MAKLANFLRAPMFVWWDITYKCNLKCKQCYSDSGKSNEELPLEKIREILNEISRLEIFYVYFLGGEPFIRKDFFDILAYCQDINLHCMVSSNGWFIDESLAKEIKRVGVTHARISIDGATASTHDSIRGVSGSFDRALGAIEALKRAGILVVGITPTIMQDNFHEIEDMIDLAVRYQVSEMQLVQLCSTGRGENAKKLTNEQLLVAKEIAKRKKKSVKTMLLTATEGLIEKGCTECMRQGRGRPAMLGCYAGRAAIDISPEGFVLPCLLYRKKLGDLKTETLSSIWRDSPEIIKLRTVPEECEECDYSDICVQECPIESDFPIETRHNFIKNREKICKQKDGLNCQITFRI